MKRPSDSDLASCDAFLLGRVAEQAVLVGDTSTLRIVSRFAITVALTSEDAVQRLHADGLVDWLQAYTQ